MSQARKGIKMLGLSLLAALSVMAVTAGAAHAVEFKTGGETFTKKGISSAPILGSAGAGELITKELKLEFRCKKAKVKGTVLLGGAVHAHVLFEECEVWAKGVLNKFCKVYETKADRDAGTNPDNILAEGLGEIKVFNGGRVITASSAAFATIWMAGGGCTLPKENAVSGSAALKAPLATTESLEHTIETITEKEEGELGVALKYGEEGARLKEGSSGTVMLESDAAWSTE